MVRHVSPQPLRILLSEGSSTSAREAVTILGLAGHRVEICDPARFPLARFSRLVAKYHRCPPLRDDPLRFLAFVEGLIARERFDVLLPIHEQGFVFARFPQRLAGVGLALPAFADYRTAHSKVGFHRVLDELGLPQPATSLVRGVDQLRAAVRIPCVIKTAIGTASRGVWIVHTQADLDAALRELAGDGFADDVLVQALAEGFTEKAQSVFGRGELLGFHAYRQLAEGAGGGDARKGSVRRERVRADLALIGKHLHWHGALSVDYIWTDGGPLYIDANPRLVEPMAAYLAGTDLVDLLLRISMGQAPAPLPESRDGILSHQAMQALLGRAQRGGTRRDVLREFIEVVRHRGVYLGSVEELTPVRLDFLSAVPLAITALALLLSPKLAHRLVRGGWGEHLLSAHTIRMMDPAP